LRYPALRYLVNRHTDTKTERNKQMNKQTRTISPQQSQIIICVSYSPKRYSICRYAEIHGYVSVCCCKVHGWPMEQWKQPHSISFTEPTRSSPTLYTQLRYRNDVTCLCRDKTATLYHWMRQMRLSRVVCCCSVWSRFWSSWTCISWFYTAQQVLVSYSGTTNKSHLLPVTINWLQLATAQIDLFKLTKFPSFQLQHICSHVTVWCVTAVDLLTGDQHRSSCWKLEVF